MYVIRAALCIVVVAAPSWWGAASAQFSPFTHFTTESDPRALPSAEVNAVYQDQLGFIWAVVYSSGLVRYDGLRMELYTPDDGLRSLAVWDVMEDAQGHLWASSNAGLAVTDQPLDDYGPGERLRFISERDGVELLDVAVRRNVMARAPDGSLWVGTDALGVVRYRFQQGRLTADTLHTAMADSDAPGADELPIRSITARGDGSMWVGFSRGQLLRYDDDLIPEKITGEGAPRSTVFALYEDRFGMLWGGNSGGRLWRLDERDGEYRFETMSTTLTSPIHTIKGGDRDRLFVASEGSGMLVLNVHDLTAERHFTRRNGLLSDLVNQLILDAEGNLWIAQSGGLSLLRRNFDAFKSFTARSQVGERPVLPAPSVGAVQPAPEGSPCEFWAATTGGIACVHAGDRGVSTYVTTADGLTGDYVNALLPDDAGRMWVGGSRGLDLIAPQGTPGVRGSNTRGLSIAGRPYQLTSFSVSSILAAATLNIPLDAASSARTATQWFATARSAMGLVQDEWFNLGEAAGLPAAVMHAVSIDDAGHLWVGTRDQGLYRSTQPITAMLLRQLGSNAPGDASRPPGKEISARLFERVWSSSEGAPTDQIESLLGHDGRMWAATPVGLFALEFDGENSGARVAAHLDHQNGLAASPAFSFALSPITGTLWVGTNGGLSEVDPQTATVLRSVTRRHGLIDNEVWFYGSVRIDEAGRVYFGTAQGLSIYDPSQDAPAPAIHRMHFRRAEIARNPRGHNSASFAYAAIGFASEGNILYRTRLRGYENEWSEPTSDASIRYTNLPAVFAPRQYTLEVMASNVQGEWTAEPLRYSFSVAPPWWLQWWMFMVYGGLVAGGAAAGHRIQRRRLVRQIRSQSRLREAEYRAQHAAAQQEAAEAHARALQAENERKEAELTKARELEAAYNELKTTQTQLIQAEKMASLGQLTAGIAHEIKNPLNFVNNFSRASLDLLAELREEIEHLGSNGHGEAIEQIVDDLCTMAEKVAQHGDRADRIVKSMLQHSRGSAGSFQDEQLNAFVEEYVNLAYHGMRAQHNDFDVQVLREYDDEAGQVQVISQEFSRVIINLLNNAFYAVHLQKKEQGASFSPRVVVRTSRRGGTAALEVEDNGPGIPDAVRQRIFEPFFTTKPTGEGTGLGLSLSYDIITQMHGGRLSVQTELGSGTTFRIELPARTAEPRSAAETASIEHPAL